MSEFQREVQNLENLAKTKGLSVFFITGKSPNWLELKTKVQNIENTSNLALSKWSLYLNPSYERIFPELIAECRNGFQSQFVSDGVNQNTIQHFRRLWTHNYLKNRMSLLAEGKKFEWFQSFSSKKIRVLFVGASPGLELDLGTIQTERQSFLIFASDTALGYLLFHGVIPDYIVSFDSGRGTAYHFLLEIPPHIPILTWLGGSAYIFDLPNPKILVNTGHPLDQILEHQFRELSRQKWPHYPNASLNLLGMVLSITNSIEDREFFVSGVSYLAERGKSHCAGTGYERFYLPETNRKKSLELTTKRLYSGERKGKNQIAWDEFRKKESLSGVHLLSESKEKSFQTKSDNTHSLQSFQGFPPLLADLAKWANQDQSGIIHRKTLNTWLRFSLS